MWSRYGQAMVAEGNWAGSWSFAVLMSVINYLDPVAATAFCASGSVPAHTASVVCLIDDLAEVKSRGVFTDSEFQAQKEKILGQYSGSVDTHGSR
jgi:hypothetical protein